MLRHEFNPIMAKMVLEFRATVDQALFEIYFNRFEHVSAASFRLACDRCVVELDYFPSVHQLLDRLPAPNVKSEFQRAQEDVENVRTEYQSIFGIPDKERGTDDLEARIDALTDEELLEIYRAAWMEANKVGDGALWFSVRKFRDNPNGMIVRGVVRDQLKEIV